MFSTFQDRRAENRRNCDLYGKKFTLYKFRTMVDFAEKKTGPIWTISNDPRITVVGKLLRYFHLDELPQLFNILKGDMSFVGPRPERPFFISRNTDNIPGYEKRFLVKPGLTGLAQISCGYDTSIEDVKKKLVYDLEYINEKKSITFDMLILLKTFKYLFSGKNGADKMEQVISI